MINEATSTPRLKRHVRDDLPMDARLPQLPTILNVEAMREQLQGCMFASRNDRTQWVVRQCEIIQVRYKPTSSCMVSYRLDIENLSTGTRGEQIVCGRAFPEGCSQSQWEKAGARALVQPRFGKPLIHLPDIEMVLWSFPNDRKMHTLPATIQLAPDTPGRLSQWFLTLLGTEWHVVNTQSRVVHYVGEHTCTVQTTLDAVHRLEHSNRIMTIYGKTYYDDEGAQTDRIMRQLWNSQSRESGQLCMAQPLRYDARLKTLWQLGIPGTTLEHCATENPERLSFLIQEAAQTVAALHTTPLSKIRSLTVADLVINLEVVGSRLNRFRPSCRPILVPLLSRLTAQANMIQAHATATLHGDLHLKNLFLTHGKIAVIDLDNVCEGPPGWDIGSFIAGLLAGALAKRSSLSQIACHLQVFLDQYNQSVVWKVDQPTVAWFTAVALVVERSHRCITRLKDNQRGQVEALLALADKISETLSLEPLADGWIDTHERSKES
ncbi:MAG: phosphotransferase [Nitrospira sp.]|nr:phosphotransferase [Nitrospira sp.]